MDAHHSHVCICLMAGTFPTIWRLKVFGRKTILPHYISVEWHNSWVFKGFTNHWVKLHIPIYFVYHV